MFWPNFFFKIVQNWQKWHKLDQHSAKNGHFWGLKIGKKWQFWGQKSAADFTKILIGCQTSKIGSLPIYRLSWQHCLSIKLKQAEKVYFTFSQFCETAFLDQFQLFSKNAKIVCELINQKNVAPTNVRFICSP